MAANKWNCLPYKRVASVVMKIYKGLFMEHDLIAIQSKVFGIAHSWKEECTHMLVDESMPVKEDLFDAIVAQKPFVLKSLAKGMCIRKYISFITSEANERCQCERRKTITAEDVLWAMGKLGFDEYIAPRLCFSIAIAEFEAYGPPFHVAPHQGILTPPMANGFVKDGVNMNSAHQPSMACFDPYGFR
ncbi:hypothetical protein IFM89_026026 [Coptis chinensis]|uniref:Uncharacterized protein n=1 Tax=Coptis chinensis TaxID=261450 RepID=A0A835HVM7_9MAGN|nr:hypothetical protein IFM89_026026 [Coptis chinensis]